MILVMLRTFISRDKEGKKKQNNFAEGLARNTGGGNGGEDKGGQTWDTDQ